MRKQGDEFVAEALGAMAAAFAGQVLVGGGAVFVGLCRILASPPDDFDKGRLFATLNRYDVKGWASFAEGAEGGSDRASAMRDALLMAYEDEMAPVEVAA